MPSRVNGSVLEEIHRLSRSQPKWIPGPEVQGSSTSCSRLQIVLLPVPISQVLITKSDDLWIEFMCNLCAIYVQIMCNYVQFMCNLCANHVQIMCNLCAIYVQIMCKLCAIYVQIMCNSKSSDLIIIICEIGTGNKW